MTHRAFFSESRVDLGQTQSENRRRRETTKPAKPGHPNHNNLHPIIKSFQENFTFCQCCRYFFLSSHYFQNVVPGQNRQSSYYKGYTFFLGLKVY